MPWSLCVQNNNRFYFLRIFFFEDDLLKIDEILWIFFPLAYGRFLLKFHLSSAWFTLFQSSLLPTLIHHFLVLCGQLHGANLKRDS